MLTGCSNINMNEKYEKCDDVDTIWFYLSIMIRINNTAFYWQSVRFGQFWKDLERFLKKIKE